MSRFTLKSLKHSEFASQETHCYQANLFLDGVKVAQVGNDGHGGCDHSHFVSKEAEAKAIAAITAERTDDAESYSPYSALEFTCCDLVNAHLESKEVTKVANKVRNRVVYIDQDGDIRTTKICKGSAENLQSWVEHCRKEWSPKSILNDMTADERIAAITAVFKAGEPQEFFAETS
jgi:hypothetical protein